MDLNKYALFVDVADTQNFTKSGERLGYTQPGVSHILKGLESELGFSLFERTHQGAILTPNAEKILPIVRNLLAVNEQLHQTVSSLNGLESGHITVAAYPSVACNWLPKLFQAFREMYPGVELELLEGGTDEILMWIEKNKADFGIFSQNHIDGLEWVPLYEDPYMVVVPENGTVTVKETCAIRDMADKQFILSTDGIDYDIRKIFSEAKLQPDVLFSCKDNHSIISMVESSLGISILPKLVLQGNTRRVKSIPLTPHYVRKIGIAARSLSQLSPAANRFIELVLEMVPAFV